jgi:hypothetical protein
MASNIGDEPYVDLPPRSAALPNHEVVLRYIAVWIFRLAVSDNLFVNSPPGVLIRRSIVQSPVGLLWERGWSKNRHVESPSP